MKYLFSLLAIWGFYACDQSGFNSNDGNKNAEPPVEELEAPNEIDATVADSTISALILDACEDEALLETMTQTLPFPQTANCNFGAGDNMPAMSGFMTAHEVQTGVVTLPGGALVCNIDLQSASNDLLYDDYFFVALNKTLLVSSEIGWSNFFDKVGELLSWDWNKVKGQPHGPIEQDPVNYGKQYCLGDTECMVPGHDVQGQFSLKIDMRDIPSFSEKLSESTDLQFEVITTGDNDDGDCDHSDLNLNVTIQYVSKT